MHAIDLSPDGLTLAAANTIDNSVELFAINDDVSVTGTTANAVTQFEPDLRSNFAEVVGVTMIDRGVAPVVRVCTQLYAST